MPGGPVAEDDLVLVSHIVTPDALGREGTTAYLGHLFVEPRRHASGRPTLLTLRLGLWAGGARVQAGLCARLPG
jgi:hypothetical protein